MASKNIVIQGAREHNLKNIDVEIPRDKLVVLTGLSGSGKSSLAFDTIYAEGQRRYMESLSSYARMFLGQMEKPNVDAIDGLSPAISIDQKTTSKNPRSTVGTVTEIYDYLRLLYARVGVPHCPVCGREIVRQSVDTIVDQVLTMETGTKIQVMAPVARGKKGEHQKELDAARRSGFVRARIDGSLYDLSEEIKLDKNIKHNIEIVVDRLVIGSEIRSRLADSVETATALTGGTVLINILDGEDMLFSQNYACPEHGVSVDELTPRMFSFNNPFGACETCTGLGVFLKVDPDLVIPNKNLSIRDGAIRASGWTNAEGGTIAQMYYEALGKKYGFTLDMPICELSKKALNALLYGTKGEKLKMQRTNVYGTGSYNAEFEGIVNNLQRRYNGVLYILDEPSIGLHQRDNEKLIGTLKHLRDLGNTLIVVEHDEDTMYAADYIVDIGPGAGVHGGNVVCAGTVEDVKACAESVTGQYLSGKRKILVPETRREGSGKELVVRKAAENNLKNIDVHFPLGKFIAVTGVSGSGKSSLVNEILYKHLANELNGAKKPVGKHKDILGLEHLDKVVDIDQSPIGRTPRSNPATYTGVFTDIRNLFAQTQDAKMHGFSASRFSFNVKGGRCEACQGDGIVKIEMHFLADVYVPCDVCKGARFNRETLEVKYKGKSIYDVLEMTIEEAMEFFSSIPKIHRKLKTIYDVGLGYVKLGQPATTLSGGEAQRVKLATELSKRPTGRTIYILDEPTTGLHTADVHRLIDVLQKLADGGNTVVVIEHNLDVIKVADHIIDLGPEGGDKGGTIVAEGSPEQIVKCKKSYTGQYLKPLLEK